MLFSDYAFTAPDGTPLVFLLVDTLRLPREKQAVLGDFYARSCKKQYGVAPFIVLYDGKDFYLRSGAFCGGFQRTHDLIPAGRLVEEVACINIVEERAWKDLLAHRKELQSLSDLDERSRRQLEIVQSSSEQTQKLLQNRDYFQKEQAALHTRTNLPEEEFLEQTMGSFDYAETRKNELLLLRNFNVEKRMCIS